MENSKQKLGVVFWNVLYDDDGYFKVEPQRLRTDAQLSIFRALFGDSSESVKSLI